MKSGMKSGEKLKMKSIENEIEKAKQEERERICIIIENQAHEYWGCNLLREANAVFNSIVKKSIT